MADSRTRLDQPQVPRRSLRPRFDAEAFGKWTEKFARFLGTGRFLIIMTAVIVAWVLFNVIPGFPHPDKYPFLFLTLALSLQASYAAPLILLAQNRQDDRDRVNLEADRDEARESKADLEYVARELAAIRISLGEVATRDFLRSELARVEETRAESKESKKKDKSKDKPREDEPAAESS